MANSLHSEHEFPYPNMGKKLGIVLNTFLPNEYKIQIYQKKEYMFLNFATFEDIMKIVTENQIKRERVH